MIVCVTGLIGAGKSTLVNNLKSKNNYTIFEEPVDNNPFLIDYYKDPARWSFTLQTYYLWERYKQSQEAFMRSMRGETVILDSTIYSDMAFALVQKWSSYFTNEEFNSYMNMHKIITAQTAYPDALLYLSLSPEETNERIKKRSRDCESGIPIKYLEDLNNAYKIVLDNLSKHTDIIYIDARSSADDVYKEVNSIINKMASTDNCYELKYV